MRMILAAAAFALALAGSAAAEPKSRTKSFTGEKYSGTRTTTVDRSAGSLSRSTAVTRAADGATASGSYARQRTANGFTATGSRTGFGGETWNYAASGTSTEDAFTLIQKLISPSGVVRERSVTRSRGD